MHDTDYKIRLNSFTGCLPQRGRYFSRKLIIRLNRINSGIPGIDFIQGVISILTRGKIRQLSWAVYCKK